MKILPKPAGAGNDDSLVIEVNGTPEDVHADGLKTQLAQALEEIAALKEQHAACEAAHTQQVERMQRASDVAIGRLREQTYAGEASQPANPASAPAITLHPDTLAWLGQNPWFAHDEAMRTVALGLYKDAEVSVPGAAEADRLRLVDEQLARIFPARFGIAPAETVQQPLIVHTQPAAVPAGPLPLFDASEKKAAAVTPNVEGGARRGVAVFARARTADLPAEARTAAQRFIKLGLFKSLDDYANSYFENPNG
jgi:hypothetical protein